MATKDEALQYLRSKFPGTESKPEFFSIELDLDEGRSHKVFVGMVDAFVIMKAPFAVVQNVNAMRALEASNIFGVSLVGDAFCLTHLLPLADLDESEILVGIGLLCNVADKLEASLMGGDRF